jgi:hypothetical protein
VPTALHLCTSRCASALYQCRCMHHVCFQGMVENRRCRDVLFLLLFVAYWVGMFIVCGIAFQSGQVSLPVSTCDCLGQQLHATV